MCCDKVQHLLGNLERNLASLAKQSRAPSGLNTQFGIEKKSTLEIIFTAYQMVVQELSRTCFWSDKHSKDKVTSSCIPGTTVKFSYSRYNSDDPDASNDGASNYSYDGMEPPLLLSR